MNRLPSISTMVRIGAGGRVKAGVTVTAFLRSLPYRDRRTASGVEFLLIHSLLGKTEHHIIDRWPLLG